MTRETYSQLETGRRKEPVTPDQAQRLSRLLEVSMVELVSAMGYELRFDGIEDEAEVALLGAYREASEPARLAARAALGLPYQQPQEGLGTSLRRLAARDRRDRQGSQE
jgi:transcriptional regulator with XRE-family HTH domain